MAEPFNTPYPPSTPIPASTPRSTSPVVPRSGPSTPPTAAVFPPIATALDPAPASAIRKPIVLHIGDPVKYNPDTYTLFSTAFDVVRPSAEERQRDEFKRALADGRWGNFEAIFRPFWGTGGEMGQWDQELIALLPKSVRVFASAGAGFDWADVKLLGERGIIYCNSGLAAADAVADFAMAMVISTFRHIPWCAAAAADPETFQDCHARATAASHTLRGQALGLIGLGNIGAGIAARAHHGFAMKIHYYDLFRKPEAVEATLGAVFHPTLNELLAASDCAVLCTPSPGRGVRVIAAPELARFRPGSRFVNIARGPLVDEEALADALDAGILSSVALDVHDGEPHVHPRLKALAGTKALLTCHNAGGTVETHIGFEELSMRNILAVLIGGEPLTPVNLEHVKRA
ncbi:D-isomer specific 2-hydroxyacid dehydrogenase [Plectosphaerella plurivora]|uniref:D-isomer specific 2-hydroxyacid dehydrogenase n=1 Tax=Plectosphaerella plurivora TaxID=936078 RepID=A0A9P8VHH4_9PEZI|nr:D-isomer specific 2-hydroxyacid dehydrogenase [Plectosphaerella plurivora]